MTVTRDRDRDPNPDPDPDPNPDPSPNPDPDFNQSLAERVRGFILNLLGEKGEEVTPTPTLTPNLALP